MAWGATRKLRRLIDNVRRILAVEYVVASRAVDLRSPLQPAIGTAAAIELLRTKVEGPGPDRYLSPDLLAAEQLLATDAFDKALTDAGVALT